MNWIKKQSSFRYNGKPVTRTTMTCMTPFGEFKVFESVGGNAFIRHPFLVDISGLKGFDTGTEEWFGTPRKPCKSIQEGMDICEQKWEKVKEAVNQI